MKKLLLFLFSIALFSPLLSNAQCTVNAGSNQAGCIGTTHILSATATQFTSFVWSTSGTGTFTNPTSKAGSYYPSEADISAGTVMLTVTASGGACTAASSSLTLTIYPWPTIEVGPDQTICGEPGNTVALHASTNGVAIQWSSSGSGTFSPNAQTTNAVYTPSGGDIISGSVMVFAHATSAQACNSPMDDLIVTILPKATISAGADIVICPGNPVTVSNAFAENASTFLWTTSGSGTFSTSTSLQTTYQPSAADPSKGSVILTLTGTSNNGCTASDDQTLVFYTNVDHVNAGPDQVIASGSAALSGTAAGTGSVIWTTSGTGTFTNNTALQTTYTPSDDDIIKAVVKLKLTSTNSTLCDAVEDEVILTIGKDLKLSGTINAGANAVDKAVVLLFKQQTSALQFVKSDTIDISDNGAYTFDHIPDGAYMLLASPITGSNMLHTYLPTYSGGTQTWNTAEPVYVIGGNAIYNITLTAYTSADANWNAGADIITGAVDIPLNASANARVQTTSVAATYVIVYLTNAAGDKIAYTQTDKSGRYAFKNVKQGVYYIVPEFAGTALAGTGTAVTVTTDGSASTTSDGSFSLQERTSSTTGIMHATASKHLLTYPNPAKNSVSINISKSEGIGELTLFSQTGVVKLQQPIAFDNQIITLHIESLPAGIYILQLVTESEIYTSKIVKQ